MQTLALLVRQRHPIPLRHDPDLPEKTASWLLSTRHVQLGEVLDVLTREHRYQLEVESAIPADILAEEGIRSLAGSHELPAPDQMFRHPNSWKGQRFPAWGEMDSTGRPVDLGPGILFPIGTVYDGLTYQYKPDAPRRRPKDDGTY